MNKINETINTWSWRIYRVGMTQHEFAKYADVFGAQISRWTNHRSVPSIKSFEKVELALLQKEKELGLI